LNYHSYMKMHCAAISAILRMLSFSLAWSTSVLRWVMAQDAQLHL